MTRSDIPFSINQDQAKNQLGEKALQRLLKLRHWLYQTPESEPLVFRAAPSIIVRSEAELFSLSFPRFALRSDLTAKSFVNVRRLAVFVDSVMRAYGTRPSGTSDIQVSDEISEIGTSFVESGQCVADSLLCVPRHLATDYQVMSAELGLAYGEGKSIEGTPFLQHIQLGGGMCAQATCFMVLCLYATVAAGVYGIAEITALSHGDSDNAIDLGGMTANRIKKFFSSEHVKLRCYREIEIDTSDRSRDFTRVALRAYASSDIPVVVPVDLGRMWGDTGQNNSPSIMERNVVPLKRKPERTQLYRKQPHTVLIVGYHKEIDTEFLVNDPATYPFLKASLTELIDARRYRDSVDDRELPDAEQASFEVISVMPREVLLPLLSQTLPGSKPVAGLLRRAFDAQTNPFTKTPQGLKYAVDRFTLGAFHLVHFCDPSSAAGGKFDWLPASASKVLLEAMERGDIEPDWFWMQHINESDKLEQTSETVWLWRASKSPYSPLAKIDGYLEGVLVKASNLTWSFVSARRSGGDRPACPPDHNCPQRNLDAEACSAYSLKPSIISSFVTTGVTWHRLRSINSLLRRPGGCALAAEVYLFMAPEVAKWSSAWLKRSSAQGASKWEQEMSAVEFLASLSDSEIREIASRLACNYHKMNIPIVALASFVPEITRPRSSVQGEQAVRAISCLIRFAQELQNLDHPTRIVEVVAGSRVDGVRIDSQMKGDQKKTKYFVELLAEEEARNRLVGALRSAVDATPGLTGNPSVCLALELEPGPYFVLRNWDTVCALADRLNGDEALRNIVGFNLDIAHWRLANIHHYQINRNDLVKNRIVHSHIAGHHRCAHFGDIPPLDIQSCKEFRPWINLLREISKDSGNRVPGFSSFVSLELEAGKNSQIVKKAIVDLEKLL
ncbi:MAG: sugar phosphate isomerase/epimerase [Pirellulales bacterium]|nr:sugar phosphate isomerase/epimerase [Pirellulales bacterium]